MLDVLNLIAENMGFVMLGIIIVFAVIIEITYKNHLEKMEEQKKGQIKKNRHGNW
jgi:hypothetical protein